MNRANHYFEMEILGTGSLGALAIGLAKTTYPLHRHPGWNPGNLAIDVAEDCLCVACPSEFPFELYQINFSAEAPSGGKFYNAMA